MRQFIRRFQYQSLAQVIPVPRDIPSYLGGSGQDTDLIVRTNVQYQRIATAPFAPEQVTLDKWYKQFQDPRALSKARPVEFLAFAYGPTPIVNNVDQWWQNLATPPKVRPRATDFPAFTYGAEPIVSNVDRWWQPLATPPKAKPRVAEFASLAYSYFVETETVTVDKWFEPLSARLLAKPRAVEFAALAFSYFVEQAEVVTVDKWFEPLSERIVKTKARATDFPPFTYGARPIVDNVDEWWQNFATPPKVKPRTAEYPYLAFTPVQAQATDFFAAWWKQWADPRKLYKDRVIEFPAFTYGAEPIVSNVDRWWQNLATPPKAKPRTVDYNAAFTPPYQLTPSDFFAGWWKQLSEPYPFKKGQKPHYQQALAYLAGPALEIITMDKWYRPYIDPRKLSKDRVVQFPPFTFGQQPIVSTPDRWWRNLETPPKTKQRAAWYQFTANFPIQPQNNDRLSWWVEFTQPKREQFGLKYNLQRSTFLTQAAPFAVNRPYSMGYIIA